MNAMKIIEKWDEISSYRLPVIICNRCGKYMHFNGYESRCDECDYLFNQMTYSQHRPVLYDFKPDLEIIRLRKEILKLKEHKSKLMDASCSAKFAIEDGDYEEAFNKLTDARLSILGDDLSKKVKK